MAEPILTVDHLVKSYDGHINILENVSFAVKPGEVIVVVGPSGCGKSTHLTVLDNILLAPTKVQKRPKAEVQKEAEALLDRVGLLQKAKSYPRELSGGQKQRVAIVRALCMHPEILLFDEVTAALDPEMVREVLDVMLDLAREGKTMIIVTHEMQFARAVANRVLFLDGGRIVEEAAPAQFFDHPQSERAKKFLNTFTFDAVK